MTAAAPTSAWSRLREHLHTTQLLGGIQSTLYFDQNTAMPEAASGWRAGIQPWRSTCRETPMGVFCCLLR